MGWYTCKHCKAAFQVGKCNVLDMDTNRVQYCVLCGSIGVQYINDTDEQWLQTMATEYGVPSTVMQLLVKEFSNQRQHQHFAGWLVAFEAENS